MLLDMLDEGAGGLDALAIARREAELGIAISTSISRDTSEMGFTAITSKLPDALKLYASMIREPTLAPADLERVKQRQLAAIAQEKAEPFGIARRVLSRQLYGEGSPYAYAGLGLESDVRAITRDDLAAFHQRWLRPDNATLLVVGDTTLAQIKPLLEASLGAWKAPAEPPPVKSLAVAAAPRPRLILMDMPGTSQSLVLAANLAPPAADPDEEAMQTVETALGGMFNSRLNMNLREARHWSYGASAALVRSRGPQIFLAFANVEQAHTADSLREMRKELVGLVGAQPLSAGEIEAAKQSQVRSLPGEFESTGEVAGAIGHLVEFGLPDDYWNRYVPQVESLQAPQLQQAAAKMVKPDHLTWIVVGDLAKVEAPVRALGFTDVQVLDADGKLLR
jgi:zinc protease